MIQSLKLILMLKLDYCASLKNLECIKGKQNYKFIQVLFIISIAVIYYLVNKS